LFVPKLAQLNLQDKYRLLLRMRKEPFAFFLPNRPQADFIRAVGTQVPDTRIFLMTSGNGTGKTTATINMIANIVYGPVNIFNDIRDVQTGEVFSGFFDYPLYKNFPRDWPHNIWYVSNKDSLKEIWKEFLNWIPARSMHYSKDGKTYISEVFFKGTDWRLSFKTVDQDIKTFETANVSIVIFDEPPPQAMFRAAISRLRKGGIIIIPATPLFSASWFVDDIIDRMSEDKDKYHQTVSVWENCIETSGQWDLGRFGVHPKGCLHKSDISFMVKNFDPDEREARENGKFQYLSGLVYKTYSTKKHFVKLIHPRDTRQYVYQFVLDPHDRRPPAAIWIRIDRWNRKRVIREWPSIHDSAYQGRLFKDIKSSDPYVLEDFVRFWIEIEEALKIPKDRVQAIIDPNYGKKPNSVSGLMLYEEYEKEFRRQKRPRSFIVDAIDDRNTGHAVVKEWLKPTKDGDFPLLIDHICYNVDWGMRNYSYEPEPTGKLAEKKDLAINVREIGKDFPDLVRYACVVECRWRPLPPLPGERRGDYGYGYEGETVPPRGEGADFA